MANEPTITIVGNLTADPELRYVASGIPVASFTVASTPRSKNTHTNQWEDGEPLFVRCSAWRDFGENVAQSLTKGTRVIVQGRLTNETYEHNGQQRSSLKLDVDAIGPDLRYATTQVAKTGRTNQANNIAYDAPAGGTAGDQWAQVTHCSPRNGTSYDDTTPPF